MEFLPVEYKSMREAVESAGLNFADFRSVKRQGKLNLYYRDHPLPFRFFRKKETLLSVEGKWEDRTVYLLYPGGKASAADGWDGVLAAFREWLGRL
jgi:hypothetical protein